MQAEGGDFVRLLVLPDFGRNSNALKTLSKISQYEISGKSVVRFLSYTLTREANGRIFFFSKFRCEHGRKYRWHFNCLTALCLLGWLTSVVS
jgi:hypothetical protein